MKRDAVDDWVGSSPHTRGTLMIRSMGGEYKRFIPAYAGNA